MTDTTSLLIAAHRGNIRRYKRLLATPLSELERRFVTRRVDEETSALRELLQDNRRPASPLSPVSSREGGAAFQNAVT